MGTDEKIVKTKPDGMDLRSCLSAIRTRLIWADRPGLFNSVIRNGLR
jgi:hypothetical protein